MVKTIYYQVWLHDLFLFCLGKRLPATVSIISNLFIIIQIGSGRLSSVPVPSLLVKSVPHKNGGAEVLVSLEEFVCKLDRCRLWKEDKFCDQNLTCKQYPSLFHPKHLKLCWAKLYYRRIYFGRVNKQGLTG